MPLETDAVDLDSRVLDELDNRTRTGGLRAAVFKVVVVVVKLNVRICGSGSSEGNGNICLADGLIEDVRTVGTVFVKT